MRAELCVTFMRSSAHENQRYFGVSPQEKNQNQDLEINIVYIFLDKNFGFRKTSEQTRNLKYSPYMCTVSVWYSLLYFLCLVFLQRKKIYLQVHHTCRANPLLQVLILSPI